MFIGCVSDLLSRVSRSDVEIVYINGEKVSYPANKKIEPYVLEREVVDFEVCANKVTIWTWGEPETIPIL